MNHRSLFSEKISVREKKLKSGTSLKVTQDRESKLNDGESLESETTFPTLRRFRRDDTCCQSHERLNGDAVGEVLQLFNLSTYQPIDSSFLAGRFSIQKGL